MDWGLIGVIITVIGIIIGVILWYIQNKDKNHPDSNRNINSNNLSKTKPTKTWEIIYDDKISIEATRYEEIPFNLNKGDKIKGIAREIDEDPFTLYVMKESDFDKFISKVDHTPFKEYEDVSSQSFKFTIPKTDCWYFVFDTYGKQKDREINVTIRKLSA
jgi:hypothetical protein